MTLKDIEAMARGDQMTPTRKEAAFVVVERIWEGLRKNLNVEHYAGYGEKHWVRCKLDGSGSYDFDGTAPQNCIGALEVRDSKAGGGQIAFTKDDVRSKTYVYVNKNPALLDMTVSNGAASNGWTVAFDRTIRMMGSGQGYWHYVFPGVSATLSEEPTSKELSDLYTRVNEALVCATQPHHPGLDGLSFLSDLLLKVVTNATGQPAPKK